MIFVTSFAPVGITTVDQVTVQVTKSQHECTVGGSWQTDTVPSSKLLVCFWKFNRELFWWSQPHMKCTIEYRHYWTIYGALYSTADLMNGWDALLKLTEDHWAHGIWCPLTWPWCPHILRHSLLVWVASGTFEHWLWNGCHSKFVIWTLV